MNNTISPITFIDKLVKKNELGQPFTLMDHQRQILRLALIGKNGRGDYDTIVYSCPATEQSPGDKWGCQQTDKRNLN